MTNNFTCILSIGVKSAVPVVSVHVALALLLHTPDVYKERPCTIFLFENIHIFWCFLILVTHMHTFVCMLSKWVISGASVDSRPA